MSFVCSVIRHDVVVKYMYVMVQCLSPSLLLKNLHISSYVCRKSAKSGLQSVICSGLCSGLRRTTRPIMATDARYRPGLVSVNLFCWGNQSGGFSCSSMFRRALNMFNCLAEGILCLFSFELAKSLRSSIFNQGVHFVRPNLSARSLFGEVEKRTQEGADGLRAVTVTLLQLVS